jgi:hypothetical protein
MQDVFAHRWRGFDRDLTGQGGYWNNRQPVFAGATNENARQLPDIFFTGALNCKAEEFIFYLLPGCARYPSCSSLWKPAFPTKKSQSVLSVESVQVT